MGVNKGHNKWSKPPLPRLNHNLKTIVFNNSRFFRNILKGLNSCVKKIIDAPIFANANSLMQ